MLLLWFCFGFGVLLPFPVTAVVFLFLFFLCLAAAVLFSVLVLPSRPTLTCVWTLPPVGHHVPLQPLVTGPHLHPSPASSPPSSSSPSTLPSSSQSSVTGPPRFSFSYPLFPHDFLLVEDRVPVCKCFHFILSLLLNWLCILVCLQWVFVRLIIRLLPLSPYQRLVADVPLEPVLQSKPISFLYS